MSTLYDTGVYAFQHIGGRVDLDDASRYVGDLAPGECRVQYWHFEYPRCSNSETPPCSGVPVWGDSVKPEDDLWLEFDIWATAGGYTDYATWKMTMRNEISAMANKIEPNGSPGGEWFNTDDDLIRPGEVITSNGIRYEFGNVRHGFDNDLDYVPDFNAWAQPIGDPSYDPSCFRLIRTSGVLTITRSAGQPDMIVPFQDQLYFTHLPPDNTGVTGNVFYTFLALDGPCQTALSPYQEVASGFDNEKFNGDYGAGIPPVGSLEPEVTLDKEGNLTVDPGERITYTLDYSNTGDTDAGLPLASAPLVFSDPIPDNTTFSGYIEAQGFTVLYSTDDGATYTTTQPSPASAVTDVQLWMTDTLAAHTGGVITFSVEVAATPPVTPVIENCADARFDSGSPFAEDCATTLVTGDNAIGDWVWEDGDSDGLQDDGPTGINGVTVALYWDADGDGELDDGDPMLTTTTTAVSSTWGNGYYLFDQLPDGKYLVTVASDDPYIPYGYNFTTPQVYAVDLDSAHASATGVTYREVDFGFGPVLQVNKASLADDPVYEGDTVTYTISLANTRPGSGDDATNDDDLDQDFGYNGNAIIDGTIWHDRDQSATATPDAGEEWLTSVTITLTNSSGAVVATTTSDADGYFRFVGNYNGTYTVTVGTGTGDMATGTWTQSFDTDGLDTGDAASVTVSTGGTARVDYSYYQTGTTAVGDTLYYDWDGDAAQDANEEGVPNVTVSLYEDHDGDGFVDPGVDALITTTVTADGSGLYPSGTYTFTQLPADDYVVVVDQADPDFPATFAQTQDPDEDGAVCVTCDGRGSADTTSGSVSDVDFGYRPAGPGVIGDTVWRDMDGDGTQSGVLETGIAAITVWLEVDLDGDGTYTRVATRTTDIAGNYLFDNLAEADYRVVVNTSDPDLPVGSLGYTYVPSTPTLDDTPFASGSTSYLDADFGFMPLGAIGDTVYWDANRDGKQDWDEGGISGVVITLTNTSVVTLADGTVIPAGSYELTQTTNATGTYLFTGLPAGTFDVVVGSISGDPALTGDPDTNGIPCHKLDSEDYLYPFCDGETSVDVSPGTIFKGADFGYQPTGVIGDFVWHDLDRDGVQDVGEPGLGGVVVTVTNGSSITTVTDVDGYYFFQDLSDGPYTVTFEPQTNMTPTVTSGNAITNGVGSVGLSTSVEISGGVVTSVEGETCTDCSLHVDSGFVLDGSSEFGGHVFFDAGGTSDAVDDSYTDGSDTGYGGVTVYLRDDQGRLVGTTVTDADGVYTFTNLIAGGTYTVAVDTDDPRLSGMDLTASNHNPGYSFAAVTLGQYDHDFGFNASVDYGDLPDSYSTSVANAGPGHVTGVLYLGASVDGEGDGAPDATASGDDSVGDDEDGIERNPTQVWYDGATVNLTATVTGDNGYLVAYFDWNGDGDIFDDDERVVFGDVVSGTNFLTLTIPSDANPGITLFSRFRLYDTTEFNLVGPTGMATNGEVEDYQWSFTPTAVDLVSFTATAVDEAILLQWRTSAEVDSLGFNRYRADAPDAPQIQLNQALILSQMPGSTFGSSYQFTDEVVELGVVYTYWLEEVDIYGRTTRYGPVTASLARHIFLPLAIR